MLDFPNVLPRNHVSDFHFSDHEYDIVGPVINCSCFRQTSHGGHVARKCLVTRRGAMLLLRPDSKDDDEQQQQNRITSSSSLVGVTSITNISHIIEFATGGFLVEHHLTTVKTSFADNKEHEMQFRITVTSGSDGTSTREQPPVLLRFGASDGSMLITVLQHFTQYVPTLVLKNEIVPLMDSTAVTPLAKLKSAFGSFRTSQSTKHLKGTSETPHRSPSSSTTASAVTTPVRGGVPATDITQRPKALRHLPATELVPIDVLKKRKPLPEAEMDRIHNELTRIYQYYAPHKAHIVPDALLQHKGIEDLLLISVIRKYGAVPRSPSSEHLVAVGEEHRHQQLNPAVLFSQIDDEDLVNDLPSARLTDDSNDLTDADEIDDLMLEINVLERACDRMVWAAATSSARGGGGSSATASTPSQYQKNVLESTRDRALSLAQCVTTICTSSTKKALNEEEQALEQQFYHNEAHQPIPQSISHKNVGRHHLRTLNPGDMEEILKLL